MQNEFEEKEKAAQEELGRAKAKLSEIDEQIRKIDECLSYKFTKVFIQGNFDYFDEYQNTWLPMLEALGNPDTNLTIKRQREAFSKSASLNWISRPFGDLWLTFSSWEGNHNAKEGESTAASASAGLERHSR